MLPTSASTQRVTRSRLGMLVQHCMALHISRQPRTKAAQNTVLTVVGAGFVRETYLTPKGYLGQVIFAHFSFLMDCYSAIALELTSSGLDYLLCDSPTYT